MLWLIMTINLIGEVDMSFVCQIRNVQWNIKWTLEMCYETLNELLKGTMKYLTNFWMSPWMFWCCVEYIYSDKKYSVVLNWIEYVMK